MADPKLIPNDPNRRPDNPLNRAALWVENLRERLGVSASGETTDQIAQRQEHGRPLPEGFTAVMDELDLLGGMTSSDLGEHADYYVARIMMTLEFYGQQGIKIDLEQMLGTAWFDGLTLGMALGAGKTADPEWKPDDDEAERLK